MLTQMNEDERSSSVSYLDLRRPGPDPGSMLNHKDFLRSKMDPGSSPG